METPKTMKAAQIVAFNEPYHIREVPVPTDLGPRDILIKVAVASHCHTDVEVKQGVYNTALPCTGSHEGSGTIVAVGSSICNLAVGDRVMGGMYIHPCGTCDECTGPDTFHQYCTEARYMGIHLDGFFAEYVRVDGGHTVTLPPGTNMIDASSFACAGRTGWSALKVASLTEGQTLAIVGSGGGIGHLLVQFAKALQLKVIGIDVREEALALTRSLGADVTLNAKQGDAAVEAAVKRATGGSGADSTINLSFARPSVGLACAVTRMHGTVVHVSAGAVEVSPIQLAFRDIRIRSTLNGSHDESAEMLDFAATHDIKVEKTLFHGLGEIEKLEEWVSQRGSVGKGCLVIDPEQLRDGDE